MLLDLNIFDIFSLCIVCVLLFLSCIVLIRHNPYFNRWFSAICDNMDEESNLDMSQSLF